MAWKLCGEGKMGPILEVGEQHVVNQVRPIMNADHGYRLNVN